MRELALQLFDVMHDLGYAHVDAAGAHLDGTFRSKLAECINMHLSEDRFQTPGEAIDTAIMAALLLKSPTADATRIPLNLLHCMAFLIKEEMYRDHPRPPGGFLTEDIQDLLCHMMQTGSHS